MVGLANAVGTLTKEYRYDAFGNERGIDQSDANPWRYCGEYWDNETGTYYLRARYYEPRTSRMLSEDPIRSGLNWYTYCGGNPVSFVDPGGLKFVPVVTGPTWPSKLAFATSTKIADLVTSHGTKVTQSIFSIRHPFAAKAIGSVSEKSNNISSKASRFTINSGLKENEAHQGSQRNAFRHALWAATITRVFGTQIAYEAVCAHEENPFVLDGLDPSQYSDIVFATLAQADEAIDMANNMIGLWIGQNGTLCDMRYISLEILDFYFTNGLWVAQQQADGTYRMIIEKLSLKEYLATLIELKNLDENGWKIIK